MRQPTLILDDFSQAFAGVAALDDGLRPVRERAFRSLTQTGFPSMRDEDWKYTNLKDVEIRSAAYLTSGFVEADESVLLTVLKGLPVDPGHYAVVFANGKFCPAWSSLPAADSGLSIRTLSSGTGTPDPELTDRIGRFARAEDFQLAALNAAFLTDALFIGVRDGFEVDRPIHVIFIADGKPVSVQPRIVARLGKASDATLIEHYAGCGPGLTNAVTEIDCERGAHLRYLKLQEEANEAYHLAAQHIRLDRDSSLEAVHVELGARLARNDLSVSLSSIHGSANLNGLFLVDGERHVDNHTRLDHFAGQTTSEENYRGILTDRGRGVFNGKIIVHPGADKTDAQLNNRNLLLSANAEIDTKPELEIYTDDVKCGHGSTTGRLDDDAMFYLRSRGIPENQGRRMLVTAFAAEIIDKIEPRCNSISEYLGRAIDGRLPE